MSDINNIEVDLPKVLRYGAWIMGITVAAALAVGGFVVRIEVRLGTMEGTLKTQATEIADVKTQNATMAEQIDRIEFRLRIPADVTPGFYAAPSSAQNRKNKQKIMDSEVESSQVDKSGHSDIESTIGETRHVF
jgi:hypothetical protein